MKPANMKNVMIFFKNVTRFEVIDEEGRTYVNHLEEDQRVKFSLQDDDRTLKVFIDSTSWKQDL